MIDFFGRGGRLKPSWYGDCLPQPGLPRAGRPLPPGTTRPRPVRERDHRTRMTSRRPSTAWSAARCSGRSWRSRDRAGRHVGGLLPRRIRLRRRQQRMVVGDDRQVVVIDAAHDHRPIARAVGNRNAWPSSPPTDTTTTSTQPPPLADQLDAPVWLHPADRMLWDVVYPDRAPDGDLVDGQVTEAGGTSLVVLATPGHSTGGICCTMPGKGWCSPETPCSAVARVPPAGAFRTTARSSTPSGTACSCSRPPPGSSPVTATRRPSAPRRPTGRMGGLALNRRRTHHVGRPVRGSPSDVLDPPGRRPVHEGREVPVVPPPDDRSPHGAPGRRRRGG